MNLERGSGILLHITSLPSPFGIGDLGPAAYTFVNHLAVAQQKYWQILPLNPTAPVYGNSPYLSVSAFAMNPLLISPELLVRDGLLTKTDIANPPAFPPETVDFEMVADYKTILLEKAWRTWQTTKDADFTAFCREQKFWLDDYALFVALKQKYDGNSWVDWPAELRDRDLKALKEQEKDLAETIQFVKFQQYMLHKQWLALREYCAGKNVRIIGDLPIYIEYGSADVWCSPGFFKLDVDKQPYVVAGVPPDYFSTTGQRWGNPIYNWEKLKADNFAWWAARLARNLKLFDIVRIDHFRGLVAYWEVPAEEETAINGKWVKAPTDEFIAALQQACPEFNVIAEDLGLITDDVKETMARYKLPGMKVLQFAFGESLNDNPYLPHNYTENCIVYTGTHDNNTTLGWYNNDANGTDKWNLGAYFQKEINAANITRNLMELALTSRANVAIFPMQDILGLDGAARMNIPGTKTGNWGWRMRPEQFRPDNLQEIALLTRKCGRV